MKQAECLLTQMRFAERMDVSVSTVKAWRRLGLLQAHRDYTWLPSTRAAPKARPSDKNIRYLWPQARDAILAAAVSEAETPSESKPAPPCPRKAQRSGSKEPALDLGYRAPP